MPQIVARSLTQRGMGLVTLAERTASVEQRNDQYVAQLIEGERWAVIDAEQIESQANVHDQDEPKLAAPPLRDGSAAERAAVARLRHGRTRRVGEVGVTR
jgi:hypothetical protein